jgi:trehalose-6-phosphatase
VLQALCADERNSVYIISGRRKTELAEWFASVVRQRPPSASHPACPLQLAPAPHVLRCLVPAVDCLECSLHQAGSNKAFSAQHVCSSVCVSVSLVHLP